MKLMEGLPQIPASSVSIQVETSSKPTRMRHDSQPFLEQISYSTSIQRSEKPSRATDRQCTTYFELFFFRLYEGQA